MTEASGLAPQPESARDVQTGPVQTGYVEIWAESLAHVLGQISGSLVSYVALPELPAESAPAATGDLWMVCACPAVCAEK